MRRPKTEPTHKWVQAMLGLGAVSSLRCMRCAQPATLRADPVAFGDPADASPLILCDDCVADIAYGQARADGDPPANPAQ